jgi:hypothetical protein
VPHSCAFFAQEWDSTDASTRWAARLLKSCHSERSRGTLCYRQKCSSVTDNVGAIGFSFGMPFRIIGRISHVETIASGKGIRERKRLRKLYGPGRWRKRKGTAAIKLADGTICQAELHWYEAHGIGAKEFKIKRILSYDND